MNARNQRGTRTTVATFSLALALGCVVLACAGVRGPSTAGSSDTACHVRSTDLTDDLKFSVECPLGEGGWHQCAHGCPVKLDVAYYAQKPHGSGKSSVIAAAGQCDEPTGNVITCHFAQASVGTTFGKGKAQLVGEYQNVAWTNILHKTEVDVDFQWFHVPVPSETHSQVIAAVERAIAARPESERQPSAPDCVSQCFQERGSTCDQQCPYRGAFFDTDSAGGGSRATSCKVQCCRQQCSQPSMAGSSPPVTGGGCNDCPTDCAATCGVRSSEDADRAGHCLMMCARKQVACRNQGCPGF